MSAGNMGAEKLLEIQGVSKHFPGVDALRDVGFDIRRNTVHCIVGENGAGKSTLIKILTGAERRSRGGIRMNGKEFSPRSTREAMNSGISVLFQELNVVNQLTVEQNLLLGKERTRFGFFRRDPRLIERVYGVLRSLDPSVGLHRRMGDLSVAQQQVIEIAKAIASESNVIIMDEPTAALSEEEVNRLFRIVTEPKKRSVTVIYISHRLREIFEIGDYVTVLRDGQHIVTRRIAEISAACRDEVESCAELIKMMLGKVVAERYVPSAVDRAVKVLEMRGVSTDKLSDVSFELYKREILGFYGLIGSGKTEIARALYGLDEKRGAVLVDGRPAELSAPGQAIARGIALVPEERRTEGLITRLRIVARDGSSVIVFSSELPEILNLCDRIILLYGGRIREVIPNGPQVDSEHIMHVVTGAVEA